MRGRGGKRGLSFLMDQSVTSTNKLFRLGLSAGTSRLAWLAV